MKRIGRNLSWLSFALIVSACGGGGDASVTTELRRIGGTSRALSGVPGVDVNSVLTIESLKVPIRAITLNTAAGAGGATIYSCAAGTNDGCLVELATGTALENLLTGAGAATVAAGTYGFVSISTCTSEGSYTGQITASGTTAPGGGTTLYTRSGSGELTPTLSEKGAATVYFSGCSRSYPLPTPITVAAGGSVSVKLYFDIRDIAFFGDPATLSGNEAWFSGGYSFLYPATPTGPYVGVNYLDVAGTVDTGTPTVQRFRVTTSTGELGTIGLISTSAGDYIGGFTRSYYDANTTSGHNRFVTPIQTFTANGDSTFTLKNYGSSATGDGYFNTTTFVKATDATLRDFTDNTGAVAGTYTIELLP